MFALLFPAYKIDLLVIPRFIEILSNQGYIYPEHSVKVDFVIGIIPPEK